MNGWRNPPHEKASRRTRADDSPTIHSAMNSTSTSKKPGRPRDPVWDDVNIDEDGIVYCLKCESRIHTLGFTHVERVKAHFNFKCSKRARLPVCPACCDATSVGQEVRVVGIHDGYAFLQDEPHVVPQGCASAESCCEDPSQQALRSPLLAECYQDSMDRVRTALARQASTLVTDAWTDVNGLSVINYVACSGRQTFFLESRYTGSDAHDADFLANDIQRIFDKYDFIEFAAVVTDNTSTNRCAWAILQETHPKIFFHGCVSHVLNLLVKDVVAELPWLNALLVKCKELVSFFKKNQKLWYSLKQHQRQTRKDNGLAVPALVMLCDTRWGSILGCFNSILKSEAILLRMVSERDFLDAPGKKQKAARRSVFAFVTSKAFLAHLKKAVRVLTSVVEYQKRFEKNTALPSEVYKAFLLLPDQADEMDISANERSLLKDLIASRFDFVYGDAHGVAYMLDPRFNGAGMDSETTANVEAFIANWHGEDREADVLVELSRFRAMVKALQGSRRFELLEKRKISVVDFWAGLDGYPLLQAVAVPAFSSACSSAASERNFSTHKFVHSTLRNRLKPISVEMLVHLFFNARNVDVDELAFLDDFIADPELPEPEATNQLDDYVYY